ncbi:MAG TPA: transposase [Urbifossiella sp.]|nr:transposase [Urbifossiella sp.]
MNGPPVLLSAGHAVVVVGQFRETAAFRGWELLAASVMFNHFHLIVRAADAVRSENLLGDFKSYASRALSQRFGKPASETWWTKSGSRQR